MVAEQMRRRLAPLIARQLDVAVDENALPGHEYIVEDHITVGFVEPARQRVIESAAGARERTARIEPQPFAIERNGKAIGVILVARLQRLNAAQVKVIRQHAGSGKLLCALDDNA